MQDTLATINTSRRESKLRVAEWRDRAEAAKVVRKISGLKKDFPEKAKAEKLAEQLR